MERLTMIDAERQTSRISPGTSRHFPTASPQAAKKRPTTRRYSSQDRLISVRLTPQISRAVPRRRLHLLVRVADFGNQVRNRVPRIEEHRARYHEDPRQDKQKDRVPFSTSTAKDLGSDGHPHSRRRILTRPSDSDTKP